MIFTKEELSIVLIDVSHTLKNITFSEKGFTKEKNIRENIINKIQEEILFKVDNYEDLYDCFGRGLILRNKEGNLFDKSFLKEHFNKSIEYFKDMCKNPTEWEVFYGD